MANFMKTGNRQTNGKTVVKKKTDITPVCSNTDRERERERDDDDYDDKEERSEQLKRFSGTSM